MPLKTRTIEVDGEKVDRVRLWGEFYFEPELAEAITEMAEGMGVNRRDLFDRVLRNGLSPMLSQWEEGREAREAAAAEEARVTSAAKEAKVAAKVDKEAAREEKLKARADAALARLREAQEKAAARAESLAAKAAAIQADPTAALGGRKKAEAAAGGEAAAGA